MSAKSKRNITSMENTYIKQQNVKEKALARRRKLLFRRLSLLMIVTISVSYLLVSTLISKNSQLEEKKVEKGKLENTLAKLDRKQSLLQDEVVKLNDDEYIAKLARSEYWFSEKGEIIFNIPETEKKKEEDVSY